ncbi:hemolysin III [Breznakia sp. PF5-3]|uniref:PAQR family membrane homeostasis protein TrhA n=1 Tax=unclassified Breznakia TaxID=2623764 RepID=UPI0024069C42|nr:MULTISPECIES: hemolysin III family protein [unclassified Breznakia]MDF9824408.1 hemolysin III [Breznakia sp. PM6-1]MDF9835137.1 hemolysin III [Breznakia sp. PF5-3]
MRRNGMKDLLKLSFGEEVFNCVSHGVMAFIMLALIPAAAVYSYTVGGTLRAFGVSVFTICIFMMFLVSTLYHAMAFDSPHKVVFRILDHIFIYFAIAGSYTPIALCLIQGIEGIIILIVQWAMVLIGILYKSLSKKSLPKLSLTIYLVMGWTAVFFIPALLQNASPLFLSLIVVGGILYSIGAYFYSRKWKFAHSIWHMFIIFASATHFIAIVFFM